MLRAVINNLFMNIAMEDFMSDLDKMEVEYFRAQLPEFEKKTREFHEGKMNIKEYKSFSGKYGSYAQRMGKRHMLRLRMTAGRMPLSKLNFVVDMAKKYDVNLVHFTTCQAVQFHDLLPDTLFDLMNKALDVDIICYGGGGDYPRNVMCSPLSGVEADEYFDVMPYAEKMADYLVHYIDREKMPRKLKVAFSNSKANTTHATFRDLGFVAREDGLFDVYAAGGLGIDPRLGVLVDEGVKPEDILYYTKAMIHTFRKYGNYENRRKARTRFMVEALGSEESFRKAYQEELAKVFADGEDLKLREIRDLSSHKEADGTPEQSWRIIEQKQKGLYSLLWHPIGGSPKLEILEKVRDEAAKMKDVELRVTPDESVYIINLTGKEADRLLKITEEDCARNPFETSVSCVGATICQVGLRDSQGMLKKAIEKVREANLRDDALPKIFISGCTSSCGTHQIGRLGFRGAVKFVDKKPFPGFLLFEYGDERQNQERFGQEVGTLLEEDVPNFLIDLGRMVEASGKSFDEYLRENPDAIKQAAKPYI